MRIVIQAVFIPEVRINALGVAMVSHMASGVADEWKTNWMKTYKEDGIPGVCLRVAQGPDGKNGSLVQKEVWMG